MDLIINIEYKDTDKKVTTYIIGNMKFSTLHGVILKLKYAIEEAQKKDASQVANNFSGRKSINLEELK